MLPETPLHIGCDPRVERAVAAADETIDKLRARYGRKVVYFGSVQDSRDTAPMRISFTHIPDLELEQD